MEKGYQIPKRLGYVGLNNLGSSSVKDAVYREAARGAHEAPSLMFLQLLLAVILTLPILLFFVTVLTQRLLRRVDSANGGDLPQTREHSLEEIGRKPKNRKSLLVLQYVNLAVLSFPLRSLGHFCP